MTKYVFLAIGIVCTATVFGQDDKIEADRPTEAQSAELVSKRTFQTELGIRKE